MSINNQLWEGDYGELTLSKAHYLYSRTLS